MPAIDSCTNRVLGSCLAREVKFLISGFWFLVSGCFFRLISRNRYQQPETSNQKPKTRTTILRPWYVLGPGHRWPYALKPMYLRDLLILLFRITAQPSNFMKAIMQSVQ